MVLKSHLQQGKVDEVRAPCQTGLSFPNAIVMAKLAPHAFAGIMAGALLLPFVAQADSQTNIQADADALVKKGDSAGAIKLLEAAAAKGNLPAKASLALFLFGLPAPYTDITRACKLARETADAGDALGMIVRADCLLTGNEQAAKPIDAARKWARQAEAAGAPGGGFELYKIYMADPQYRVAINGKPDDAKYRQLAARPLAERSEQIEALNGLAFAALKGNNLAMLPMLGYLIDTTAPGNAGRVVYLADLMQKNGMAVPAPFAFLVQKAQQMAQAGNSNASVKIFDLSYDKIVQAVATQVNKTGHCEAKDIKLAHIEAEAPKDGQFLPLEHFLTNSYLVQGNWHETWTFSACDKTVAVTATFKADGWGSAAFEFNVPAQK